MATKTNTLSKEAKRPIAEVREAYQKLLDGRQTDFRCYLCGTWKHKREFYMSTDPICKTGVAPICKRCAAAIANRRDADGFDHTPTKDSIKKALFYLNKPFINSVYDSSIQEVQNTQTDKQNVWGAYIKNISMPQFTGMGYFDGSEFQATKVLYADEITDENIKDKDVLMYEEYQKNKADTIRLIGYDPFETESANDQVQLYSNLIGLLDASEDANDDMMRVAACITIVRSFNQLAKFDDLIATLMADTPNIAVNSATIKSLEDMKNKVVTSVSKLAEDNCISLKHSKNSKKGENTWTGKLRKIKEMNLREAEVNGFDMRTCHGMKQVMDMSNRSILEALKLDESEYSDMLAEMRQTIVQLNEDLDNYKEICRIILRENLDLKSEMEEAGILESDNLVDLNTLFSPFSISDDEDGEDE